MNRIPKPLLLFALAALATGCATVKVDPGRCDSVRSVAIVGYDVHFVRNARQSSNNVVNFINTAKAVSQLASGDIQKQEGEQAAIAYNVFAAELARSFGWQIVPYETVIANPVYARLLEKYKHRPSNGTPRLPGLLGGGASRSFEPAEQTELARSLGVEGVVALEVAYHRVRHTKVAVDDVGTGSDYLQAVLALTVMDGGEKPAWRDVGAAGELSDTRMPVVMGVETDTNLSAAMQEATVYSVGALFARYQHARIEAEKRAAEAAAAAARAGTAQAAEAGAPAPMAPAQAAAAPSAAPVESAASALEGGTAAQAAESTSAPSAAPEGAGAAPAVQQ